RSRAGSGGRRSGCRKSSTVARFTSSASGRRHAARCSRSSWRATPRRCPPRRVLTPATVGLVALLLPRRERDDPAAHEQVGLSLPARLQPTLVEPERILLAPEDLLRADL